MSWETEVGFPSYARSAPAGVGRLVTGRPARILREAVEVSATDPRLREEPGWATVVVPGVETLSSSARTLKHNDTFALLDEFGDICAGPLEPAGLFHKDTRHLSRLELRLEGHRPLLLASTVRTDNVVLDVNLTNPDFFAGGEGRSVSKAEVG